MSPSTRRETICPSPWWRSANSIREEIESSWRCINPSMNVSSMGAYKKWHGTAKERPIANTCHQHDRGVRVTLQALCLMQLPENVRHAPTDLLVSDSSHRP